ncbi:hypothetical protein XENOCAPTIV_014090 [Xenoophorus captivus]|uniref:Uncharacterized protein n=1 Tax=Xenoophorus captivus TaxID=1517983 RepID=A0ABV0Q3S3_9TELE
MVHGVEIGVHWGVGTVWSWGGSGWLACLDWVDPSFIYLSIFFPFLGLVLSGLGAAGPSLDMWLGWSSCSQGGWSPLWGINTWTWEYRVHRGVRVSVHSCISLRWVCGCECFMCTHKGECNCDSVCFSVRLGLGLPLLLDHPRCRGLGASRLTPDGCLAGPGPPGSVGPLLGPWLDLLWHSRLPKDS